MDCDKYLKLLALRLDGDLTREEARELEEHLSACPDCRAAGAQLAALQAPFDELGDIAAPEGFAQSVMERIRKEARPKVIPLFKRHQVRALVGLAACLVLAVGIYGITQRQDQEKMMLMNRSFQRDVLMKEPAGAEGSNGAGDSLPPPEPVDAPQIAAYTAPSSAQGEDTSAGTAGMEPNSVEDGLEYGGWKSNPDMAIACADTTLILDRLPQGAAELIPPETAVTCDQETGVEIYWLTWEQLSAVEQLAYEQGLLPGTSESAPLPERCALIVQNR